MAVTNLLSGIATEETQIENGKNLNDVYNLLSFYLDRLEFGMITDSSKRLKVNIDAGTLGTITTVTTVNTVGNQSRFGDIQAQRQVEAIMDMSFNNGILKNITF